MTEPTDQDSNQQPGASDTGKDSSGTGTAATAILESIRDVVDDLAERATPAVREFSAKAAELAAVAADRAAPLVKRAGDATSEASGKLASKSRAWAADVRSTIPPDHDAAPAPETPPVTDLSDDASADTETETPT
jgi:hypothetical protein